MIRMVVQIGLILLPLLLFAMYRIATASRGGERGAWPFAVLLCVGIALSASFYVIMFITEPRGERTCSTPDRFVNGELVPGQVIPCEGASIDTRRN